MSRYNAPSPDAPRDARCEWPECACDGQYKAPRSRSELNRYRWFCLDHVRQYNASWDYFAGMGPEEIEAQLRSDSTWQRPTWRFGTRPLHGAAAQEAWDRLHDPFDVLGRGGPEREHDHGYARGADGRSYTPAERKARAVFQLAGPLTLAAVKTRYKELVKRHHPDANGGDKAAEERLKIINEAYTTLRQSLSAQARQA